MAPNRQRTWARQNKINFLEGLKQVEASKGDSSRRDAAALGVLGFGLSKATEPYRDLVSVPQYLASGVAALTNVGLDSAGIPYRLPRPYLPGYTNVVDRMEEAAVTDPKIEQWLNGHTGTQSAVDGGSFVYNLSSWGKMLPALSSAKGLPAPVTKGQKAIAVLKPATSAVTYGAGAMAEEGYKESLNAPENHSEEPRYKTPSQTVPKDKPSDLFRQLSYTGGGALTGGLLSWVLAHRLRGSRTAQLLAALGGGAAGAVTGNTLYKLLQ